MAHTKMKPLSVTYLFQKVEADKILQGITLAALQSNAKESESPKRQAESDNVPADSSETENPVIHAVSEKMECSSCLAKFEDRTEQRDHYRSDWHRFNLKQKLKGENPVSEEQFEDIVGGDLSSISGSDTDESDSEFSQDESAAQKTDESEDERSFHVEGIGHRHPRVFFRNAEGDLISIYRCVLHCRKNRASTQEELLDMAKGMTSKMRWAIFLTAGGHFAGAVLEGNEVVLHKTFHRYIVRAKRGTVQSQRDKQGNAPKSAGASIRRHNEAALTQEIQDLILSWRDTLLSCDRIFLKSPSYNKGLYFSGKNSPLTRSDKRIRHVPFVTRRPTFSELQRVHEILAAVHSYGAEGSIKDHIKETPKKSPVKPKFKSFKQQERERKAKGQSMEENTVDSSDAEDIDITLEMEDLSINFSELKEFDATKKPKRRKKKGKSHHQEDPSTSMANITEEELTVPEIMFNEKQYKLRNILYSACKMSDLDLLKEGLEQCSVESSEKSSEKSSEMSSEKSSESTDNKSKDQNNDNNSSVEKDLEASTDKDLGTLLNEPFGGQRQTLLHIAASVGFSDAVELLMEAGCDPAVIDTKRTVPYSAAKDKETRQAFRRFMGKFPEKYDYDASKIPSPLTPEMESAKKAKEAERRKAQKKAKKERTKEKREEEKKQKDETKEQQRYLGLSDREKRALAAERRLVSQMATSETSPPCLSRCFQCGVDITGKVPFEYSENRFCSPKCLKEHRFKDKPR